VLFPQPDEPTRATVVSAATRRVRPRRTWMQIRDHQRAIRGHPRPSSEGHQRSSEGRQRVIRRSPQVIRGPSERISHAADHMRSEAAAPADRKPLGSSEVTRRSSDVIRPPHRPIDSRWGHQRSSEGHQRSSGRRTGRSTAVGKANLRSSKKSAPLIVDSGTSPPLVGISGVRSRSSKILDAPPIAEASCIAAPATCGEVGRRGEPMLVTNRERRAASPRPPPAQCPSLSASGSLGTRSDAQT